MRPKPSEDKGLPAHLCARRKRLLGRPQISDGDSFVTCMFYPQHRYAGTNRNILASGSAPLPTVAPRRSGWREVTAPAILQVIPGLDAGGAERTTIDIAKALTASGYRALVATEGGRLERDLMLAGGELIRANVGSKTPHQIIINAPTSSGRRTFQSCTPARGRRPGAR